MKKTTKQAIGVGAGLAAIAAAAAGVYMLTGKNAKNRKKIAKWAKDMKSDVVKELNDAGKATKQTYNKVVDQVASRYEGLKNVGAIELAQTVAELKSHWDAISEEAKGVVKTAKKVVPKAKKAASKSAAKKTAAKKTATKKSR